MARKTFEGVYVPLVTPFRRDGTINEEALRELVRYLVGSGVHGLVPGGTTGEHFTMSHDEQHRVIEVVIDEVPSRIYVIAGAGSNNTLEAISLTKFATDAGADALLHMGPYANKPTQQGIIEHYKRIAQNTELPIIVYNIPARTARNIEPATIIELARIPNITGLKDACGDLNQTMQIIEGTRDLEFSVLSGEDALTLPMYCLGACGEISATAHIAPEAHVEMYECVKRGDMNRAREIHYALLPLIRALFAETNPSPLKAALNILEFDVGEPRLPLVPATEKCRNLVRNEMERTYAALRLKKPNLEKRKSLD